jgi:hypothetical protein
MVSTETKETVKKIFINYLEKGHQTLNVMPFWMKFTPVTVI